MHKSSEASFKVRFYDGQEVSCIRRGVFQFLHHASTYKFKAHTNKMIFLRKILCIFEDYLEVWFRI